MGTGGQGLEQLKQEAPGTADGSPRTDPRNHGLRYQADGAELLDGVTKSRSSSHRNGSRATPPTTALTAMLRHFRSFTPLPGPRLSRALPPEPDKVPPPVPRR